MKPKRKEKLVGVWLNKKEEYKCQKLMEKHMIRDMPKLFRYLLRKEKL